MFRISIGFFTFALLAATLVCPASAQQPPPEGAPQATNPYGQPSSNAPAPSAPNPALLKHAKVWFAELQSGKVDPAQLATSSSSSLNQATIANAQKLIGGLGTPVSFVQQQTTSQGGVSYAIYLVTFKNGQKVDFLFAMDGEGKVTSLGLGTPK
jgi:hypothetical protein